MAKQKRFTPEYKVEIVKLVTEQNKIKNEVARSIGVSEAIIRDWVKKYS